MGRGTAWLHGSCLLSPHQHRGTGRNTETPSSGLWPGASLVEDGCIHGNAWGILCPSGAACPTIEAHPWAGGLPRCFHGHQALLAPALPARHRPWWPPQGCGARRQCLAPACRGLCTATMVLPARPALSPAGSPACASPALRHPEDPRTHPCTRWLRQPAAAARTGQGYPRAKCWWLSWCSPRTPTAGAGQQGFISARGWGGAATHITFGY